MYKYANVNFYANLIQNIHALSICKCLIHLRSCCSHYIFIAIIMLAAANIIYFKERSVTEGIIIESRSDGLELILVALCICDPCPDHLSVYLSFSPKTASRKAKNPRFRSLYRNYPGGRCAKRSVTTWKTTFTHNLSV